MNAVLLDTHVVLWWLLGGSKLSAAARSIIQNPGQQMLVSAVSAWEIAIKFRAGKLEAAGTLVGRFQAAIEEENFVELPISVRHALDAGLLSGPHRDPFDRILIVQARAEGVPVLSTDKCFDDYGVSRLW
jgi:PIN domain nuclease of toxin-antitoxin system